MNKLRILLDRHFPYDSSALKSALNQNLPNGDSRNGDSRIDTRELSLPEKLPYSIARIYHALDIYYRSFTTDVVLGNRRTVLLMGLLYHLYKPKKVSLIGYEIIFNFKDSFKHKLVKWIWRRAVRRIDKLVVMTKSERNYLAREFSTFPEKFSTIPFYSENAEYIGPKPEGYIFAAGRMERDFETLLHSLSGTNYPAIIVADENQKEKLEKIKPPQVEIFYNIPRERYLSLLQNSKMVVVPLYEGAASRGQVVILEAMKFGKPVVCTKVEGTADYLNHGKDGIFVEPNKPEALRNIFNTWFNEQEALEKMGKQAFQSQQTKHSPEVFFRNYAELIIGEYRKKNNISTVAQPQKEVFRKEEGKVQAANSR